ncbi:hypothetical protein [Pseudomonas sp. D1HM]|uniref:hypothetical protein n=1 Tax=Pseudomonas sp. D1HM TaxID=1784816 RepID=UPI001C4E5470|nr:hypothetical protein [Pseudomonas sp. D1HM]MBW0236359.1 hypothetical protein [Pseudomonas sp. D1HM]
MYGQIVILPGVTAAAGASAERIDMTASDLIAAKIPGLKHMVSARSLTALPGGGVSGRCQATGAPLVPKGLVTALAISEVAGKKALGLSSVQAAGLGLPAGSATASYTAVMVVSVAAADVASGSPSAAPIFLSSMTAADALVASAAQYYGTSGSPPNIFAARGSNTASPFVSVPKPETTWAVLLVDYNDTTKVVSLAVNQAKTFATATKTVAHTPGTGGYFEIGAHVNATASLRASKIGDLYLFEGSLLTNALARTQISDLIAVLKAEYIIS